jgi:fumarate reductase iron-sulfur subunit
MGHAALAVDEIRQLRADIWRGGEDGRFVSYEVPVRESQTVLDIVTHVQRRLDPTLAYRFACRVGMCGSCAMMVNGVPRWTCRTHVRKVVKAGRLEIAPLRNLPRIRDLVVDMAPFFDRWQKAGGRFSPRGAETGEFARVEPSSPAPIAADAGIECIGCGICHAACDVVAWRSDYLGPAALNRAWTLVNDVRDGERSERLRIVADDGGCHNCHSTGSCAAHCPKHLNPTAAIAGLKREVTRALVRGEL